jgi:hypothetical protein
MIWDRRLGPGGGDGLRGVARHRRLEVLELVAGEETRSREAGQNAEVPTRHLMPLGAALRAGNPVRTGCGDGEEFHGPVPLGLSIPYRDNGNHRARRSPRVRTESCDPTFVPSQMVEQRFLYILF